MLFWRILLGIPIIAGVAVLAYLDMWLSDQVQVRGIILLPLFLVVVGFLCDEILDLLEAGGLHPRRSTVWIGILAMTFCCWLACAVQEYKSEEAVSGFRQEITGNNFFTTESTEGTESSQIQSLSGLCALCGEEKRDSYLLAKASPHGWHWAATASLITLLAMAGGMIIVFAGEILRYARPGGTLINLAGAVFAISYIGLLACFIIQLRMAFGIAAVLSLVVVAKMCDTGAYAVGRIFGTRKMIPSISPGKTIEGFLGGIAFAILGAWIWFNVVIPLAFRTTWFAGDPHGVSLLGWLSFGLVVAISSVLGDLSASLIKRDVKRKDSSSWMPGFGGFLDIFDSLLIAAPVAYAWWAFRLVS